MTNSALILIDIQRGFDLAGFWDGPRNNLDMETNARALLAAWRQKSAPIYIVQHKSRNPGSPFAPDCEGYALKPGFEPKAGETHIVKTENSAFVGTNLQTDLQNAGITDLTICGATTEHCVSTTVRMAENLGFAVTLVQDACFSTPHRGIPAAQIHDTEIAILSEEFATIKTTQEVLAK